MLNIKVILAAALICSGCHLKVKSDFQAAKKFSAAGENKKALLMLDQVLAQAEGTQIESEAAREAARIAFFELKDFKKSVEYYKKIVLSSTDAVERLNAQKQVAAVYFEHLADYPNAIIEINKILPLIRENSEKLKYKMDLARAYYYQNNFFQAEMEVDEFLIHSKNEEQNFQMKLLKANIVLARKDLARAAEILKEMQKNNPERAKKENVGLTLAVAYEEMGEYKKAIETLEELRELQKNSDFIDLRIKRLQERLKNQPGARGFRK